MAYRRKSSRRSGYGRKSKSRRSYSRRAARPARRVRRGRSRSGGGRSYGQTIRIELAQTPAFPGLGNPGVDQSTGLMTKPFIKRRPEL